MAVVSCCRYFYTVNLDSGNAVLGKLDGKEQDIKCPIPYRRVFFDRGFFLSVHFCMQTPGTYLHHTVSMVGLPDPALLIFPSTCTGNLVPFSFQK
jgi:hypothetical protein